MINIQLDEKALAEASLVTLSWNYPDNEIDDSARQFAIFETRNIVEAYFEACRIRVVK